MKEILSQHQEQNHLKKNTPHLNSFSAQVQLNLLQGVTEATNQLLTSNNFEDAIAQALVTLGRVTQVDRIYVSEIHSPSVSSYSVSSQPALILRFQWIHEAVVDSLALAHLSTETLPFAEQGLTRWYEALLAGSFINGAVETFPQTEQEVLRSRSIRSMLILPIFVRGQLWGSIGLEDYDSEGDRSKGALPGQRWLQDEIAILGTMAANLGGAIAHQQAVASLQESESRFQRMTANVPGLIYQFLRRPDGFMSITFASSGCGELFEVEPEAAQADFSLLLDLLHPDDRESFLSSVEISEATLQPWMWEGRFITQSGKLMWIQGRSRPVRQNNGDTLWDGLLVDITERKQTEEELREERDFIAAVLETAGALVVVLDRQGRIVRFNRACEQTTGYSREEVENQYFWELFLVSEEIEPVKAVFSQLQTGQFPIDYENYWLTKTGHKRLLAWSSTVFSDVQGEVKYIIGIGIDITERKQAEEELRRSEEMYRTLARNFPNGAVFLFDHDLRYAIAEGTGLATVGLSKSSLEGKTIWEALPAETCEFLEPNYRAALAGTTTQFELPYEDQVYILHALPVKDERGKIFAGMAMSQDITERKQAEIALQRSEARNRALLNAIPDVMFRISKDGTYLDARAETDVNLLVSPKDIIGRNVYDVLSPDLAKQRMDYVELALQTGEIQAYNYQLPLNGEPHYYEARIMVSGQDEVLAIVRDITERIHAEEALRVSEERFSKAFRSSPNPLSISTLEEGRYIDVNESFLQLSGYQREEVINHTVLELNVWINMADRDRIITLLQTEGAVHNKELEFRNKFGAAVTVLYSAEMIKLQGKACVLSVSSDISERKRAEVQLRKSVERDRLLAQTALRVRESLDLDQILTTTVLEVRHLLQADRVFVGRMSDDLQQHIIAESVAPNLSSMIDFVPDEAFLKEIQVLFGQTCAVAIDDTTYAQLSSVRCKHFEQYQVKATLGVPIVLNEQFIGVLVAHQCTGPRRWQKFEIALLENLATQVAIAIHQAELYRQVQNLNTNLEQQVEERTAQLQQKMQELQELYKLKDVFLHAFSHDLRTPIMGTSMVLNNLLNSSEANSSTSPTIPIARSILERIVQGNDRQLNLINSLLESHASEVQGIILHNEPTQLSTLVQSIVEDIEPILAKNQATLVNLVSLDLSWVNVDPTQLRRVFENLLINALKHNPPHLNLILNTTVKATMLRCTIQDDGVGMTQAECDRLFELYVRGSRSRYSTSLGLGLYLCRQIIKAHGGEIGAISKPKAGATFWFTLPIFKSEESEM